MDYEQNIFFFFFFFFFGFSFTSLSSFFTHIETNQSVGGAKTGVPGEKPPDTPASRTWLVSHMNYEQNIIKHGGEETKTSGKHVHEIYTPFNPTFIYSKAGVFI